MNTTSFEQMIYIRFQVKKRFAQKRPFRPFNVDMTRMNNSEYTHFLRDFYFGHENKEYLDDLNLQLDRTCQIVLTEEDKRRFEQPGKYIGEFSKMTVKNPFRKTTSK